MRVVSKSELEEKFVQHQTVSMLRRLLAEAEAGTLQGAMVFAEYEDGAQLHVWSDTVDYQRRIAQVEQLKFLWMCESNGIGVDEDGS